MVLVFQYDQRDQNVDVEQVGHGWLLAFRSAVDVFHGQHRRAGPPWEYRHTALEPHVGFGNPTQECTNEVVARLTSLAGEVRSRSFSAAPTVMLASGMWSSSHDIGVYALASPEPCAGRPRALAPGKFITRAQSRGPVRCFAVGDDLGATRRAQNVCRQREARERGAIGSRTEVFRSAQASSRRAAWFRSFGGRLRSRSILAVSVVRFVVSMCVLLWECSLRPS
jgi:hypothetical protein